MPIVENTMGILSVAARWGLSSKTPKTPSACDVIYWDGQIDITIYAHHLYEQTEQRPTIAKKDPL